MAKHKGYKIIKSIGDVANLETAEKKLVVDAINELKFDTGETTSKVDSHISSVTPHKFEDLKSGKFYLFGLQKSEDGVMQIITEEII